ncbi:MAG TPA: chemotaxis protein CheB [Kofleriaceae bacterium]
MLRDVVVIGASAGGVEAIPRILGTLPTAFPAAILIVQHMGQTIEHHYPEIWQRATALPVRWAEQGERIDHGHVYVAPRGVHMLVVDGHLRLEASAQEKRARPSIDVLFRSVASVLGPRAIGVLLTGLLDDGAAGMGAIHEARGFTIIQDPESAHSGDLPANALATLAPDRVLPLERIGPTLIAIAGTEVPSLEVPREKIEAALWSAVRALHERADALDERANDARASGRVHAEEELRVQASEARDQAEIARAFVGDFARR